MKAQVVKCHCVAIMQIQEWREEETVVLQRLSPPLSLPTSHSLAHQGVGRGVNTALPGCLNLRGCICIVQKVVNDDAVIPP